jgi:hypothetical protein
MNFDPRRPLCALLFASMLVACGGGGGDPSVGPAPAVAATTGDAALATTQASKYDECSTDQ